MKNIIIVVVAFIAVVSTFAVLEVRYNKVEAASEYWYEKYSMEKNSHREDLKNLSEIVFDAYKNKTITDDGYSLWFEDFEYCSKDSYCAVYIEPGVAHIIK